MEKIKYYKFYSKEFKKESNVLDAKYIDRIFCADSEKFLKELPDNSIDLILTSPPYNFNMNYDNVDDNNHWPDYFEKLFKILNQCTRVLKYGGRMAINIQPSFSNHIPTHHFISNHLMDKGLIWRNEIMWNKHNYNCNYTAWGSWKSPSSPHLKYKWEFIEVFSKGDIKKIGEKDNIDISGDEFKKWVDAEWSMGSETKMKSFGHPAMFPEELSKRIIKLFSYKKDIVLDPFNGAGTTTKTAVLYGRKYIGIDISKKYCKIAKKRLGLFANND